MPTTYSHFEFKGNNYLLMGYVLSTSFDAARALFARVTGAPHDRVNTLTVKYTDMPVSENTIFPSDADESRPHNMLERDQSGKRFHLNPEPENKKAGQEPVASDLYEALGLMEHVKNALDGPGINKAALDWITQAKAIVLRAANQPSTDDVVVPGKTAREVNLLLRFLLQQTAHRYITERQEKHVIRAFDDLVNPKKTRTFHVEVTGTRYDLERALENIRKVSNANSLRASISEDTE